MSILTIQNINFQYNEDTQIFNNLNLTFTDNTSTAIIGQNGAGKTTLVKLIKGLLEAQSGNIFYHGKDTKTMNVTSLAQHIGLVFQNPDDQIFKSNVLEEVMFGPLNIGMTETNAKTAAMSALTEVGLEEAINENPYDLNLSDRKMIAIASILAMNTEIVIFDEPTIAQDFRGKQRIGNIISRLKQAGKLVITIIHDMDFVAEHFDRTIILAKGEKLVDADTKTAFQQKDALTIAHLRVPHIMEVAETLGYQEQPLNVAEFVAMYKK